MYSALDPKASLKVCTKSYLVMRIYVAYLHAIISREMEMSAIALLHTKYVQI